VHVLAIDQDAATMRPQLPADQLQQRRLPRATRTHDRRDSVAVDVHIHTVEDWTTTAREMEIADLDQGLGG
jgi:hypothetical protein